METTAQPYRHMLRRICSLGRFAGWALIVMGLLGGPGLAYAVLVARIDIGMHETLDGFLDVSGQILTGMVVLGMVQFIRYVAEEGVEPRWLLRNGHIVLCLLALSMLLTIGLHSWPQGWINLETIFGRAPEGVVPWDRRLSAALVTFTVLLPAFAKVLCVLGIAAILRAVLPILAESKTLA